MDIMANFIGIKNVLAGSYSDITYVSAHNRITDISLRPALVLRGVSFYGVLRAAGQHAMAETLAAEVAEAEAAIEKIPVPFDNALVDAGGQKTILAAIEKLRQLGRSVKAAGELLQAEVSIELGD